MEGHVARRFSQTKAGKHPVMKGITEDQTEASKGKICAWYWCNILLNVVVTTLFLIFTISNVGDAEECYIVANNPNLASRFKQGPNSVNWAKRFEFWFLAGVIISILNAITFTASTLAKLKGDKKTYAYCQLAGCFPLLLTIGHFIWIFILRYWRHEGQVVAGDFLAENASDVTK